ncbi:Arm DNA-binding domain-containing protein [Mucilaginibacter sp. OK283]|jgi:hypothetical protein|uniref:Arm DNA-binding domain-containing protein n=1 Tax=Mucilaginibacter sp. OK283 TaxID=1881049 RepID=UPI000B890189|nr:Arm DNA-binding domain-containing protein [Mucilaginibacter sp. OK283]
MKTNFSLLFYLKKPKNYTDGPVPIYLRITVAGKRSETTTARSCDPLQWNSKAGRLKGTKEASRTFNAYLDQLLLVYFGLVITAAISFGFALALKIQINALVELLQEQPGNISKPTPVQSQSNNMRFPHGAIQHKKPRQHHAIVKQ